MEEKKMNNCKIGSCFEDKGPGDGTGGGSSSPQIEKS